MAFVPDDTMASVPDDGGCIVSLHPTALARFVDNSSMNGPESAFAPNRGKNTNVMSLHTLRLVCPAFLPGVKMEATAVIACPASEVHRSPTPPVRDLSKPGGLLYQQANVAASLE